MSYDFEKEKKTNNEISECDYFKFVCEKATVVPKGMKLEKTQGFKPELNCMLCQKGNVNKIFKCKQNWCKLVEWKSRFAIITKEEKKED
jgi:hypothetical protein